MLAKKKKMFKKPQTSLSLSQDQMKPHSKSYHPYAMPSTKENFLGESIKVFQNRTLIYTKQFCDALGAKNIKMSSSSGKYMASLRDAD